ncbi:disulfide bond formation protein DsbC, partial [Cronobacter dublinensis subsp. dublinensis]|nr:disulfide bond formation protein DsbC [Cronobacter dublinensis subsp. dublinensis]
MKSVALLALAVLYLHSGSALSATGTASEAGYQEIIKTVAELHPVTFKAAH